LNRLATVTAIFAGKSGMGRMAKKSIRHRIAICWFQAMTRAHTKSALLSTNGFEPSAGAIGSRDFGNPADARARRGAEGAQQARRMTRHSGAQKWGTEKTKVGAVVGGKENNLWN